MAQTEQAIRDRLGRLCPLDADPALGPDAMDEMVTVARRADADGNAPDTYPPWQPGAAYALTDIIVPTVRNRRAYRPTQEGTSGTVEPVWPVSGTVTDGGVIWAVAGSAAWTPTWDLSAGAARGWRMKAAVAVGRYDFSTGTDRHAANQVYDHCIAMARLYEQGRSVASVPYAPASSEVERWASVLGN
jgi:hypothetical protein